uniref:Uncharacterized protein n=1 Tax=Euplotes harpa TaxID=151035 RepID=A0A7S3J0R9_9SPIT|mmetsp:Transcript_10631/g.11948  ORF Transcript_10631/g.11948 Transcript_10631/m.11948 type:complete len:100 (+) Transcript_10631:624-923(+)
MQSPNVTVKLNDVPFMQNRRSPGLPESLRNSNLTPYQPPQNLPRDTLHTFVGKRETKFGSIKHSLASNVFTPISEVKKAPQHKLNTKLSILSHNFKFFS